MSNSTERQLLERIATAIGEALIANEISETAIPAFASLQNEITARLAQPSCGKTWFVAGGRDERTCGEPAEVVCSRCEKGFCDEHFADEAVYRIDDKPVCENCLEPFELTDDTPIFEI